MAPAREQDSFKSVKLEKHLPSDQKRGCQEIAQGKFHNPSHFWKKARISCLQTNGTPGKLSILHLKAYCRTRGKEQKLHASRSLGIRSCKCFVNDPKLHPLLFPSEPKSSCQPLPESPTLDTSFWSCTLRFFFFF